MKSRQFCELCPYETTLTRIFIVCHQNNHKVGYRLIFNIFLNYFYTFNPVIGFVTFEFLFLNWCNISFKECENIPLSTQFLKVHKCRFKKLPISSCLHESDVDDFILKYLLIFEMCERFVVRYVKGLFTNMQKQQNIVKIS